MLFIYRKDLDHAPRDQKWTKQYKRCPNNHYIWGFGVKYKDYNFFKDNSAYNTLAFRCVRKGENLRNPRKIIPLEVSPPNL